MKILLRVCAFLLTFLSACAAEFAWPGHGTITLDVPASWTLDGASAGEVAFNFRGDANAASAAVFQLSLVALPPGKPAPPKEEAKDRLKQIVADALNESVEKEFSPRALKLKQGYGWYVQLTDASLVGKPPQPENLKVMRNALAFLDESTMAVITMQFDDPGSAAPDEMLRMVASLQLQHAQPNALQIRRTDEYYELNVPLSRLTLKIPVRDLVVQTQRAGGSTSSPRYFHFQGTKSGMQVSGWFEQPSRYSDLVSFWKSETEGFKRGGQPEPMHVHYGKAGDWETIEYDMSVPNATNAHLRAELTRAGVWIDLHVSITADQPAYELHTALRNFIESLVTETR